MQSEANAQGLGEVGLGVNKPREFVADVEVKSIEEYYDDWTAFTGAEDAYREEIAEAETLLEKAPTGRTPFEVALYFYDLRAGSFGNELARYGHEWPLRYNPVIVKFFESTSYKKPKGDTTAWSSAFMNHCVYRSRAKRPDRDALTRIRSKPTGHAGALSWKDFGRPTEDPQIGDIVVFARTDA